MVVGDRPDDLRAALDFLRGERMDLVITTGGLGPTADDLTAEVVAGFAGLEMELDEALEGRIWAIISELRGRWRDVDEASLRAGNRKQALVPRGAMVMEPVGTAPGLVVAGRARRSRAARAAARAAADVGGGAWRRRRCGRCCRGAGALEQRIMRLIGLPESEIARTLRDVEASGVALDRLEITTCLRRGELEIATVFPPAAGDVYAAFEAAVLERHGERVFSRDGATIDEIVAGLLRRPAGDDGGDGRVVHRRADGGAADRPAGVVGVRAGRRGRVLERGQGGARRRCRRELIERVRGGVAGGGGRAGRGARLRASGPTSGSGSPASPGPDGGTPEKPVGTVCLCVAGAGEGRRGSTARVRLPGDRTSVRERTTTVGLHLLRRLLL